MRRFVAILLALLVIWTGVPLASTCARAAVRMGCGGCHRRIPMPQACRQRNAPPPAVAEITLKAARVDDAPTPQPFARPPGCGLFALRDSSVDLGPASAGCRTAQIFLRTCALLI